MLSFTNLAISLALDFLFHFVILDMILLLFTEEEAANATSRASCPTAKTDLTNGLHVAIVITQTGGKTKALLV